MLRIERDCDTTLGIVDSPKVAQYNLARCRICDERSLREPDFENSAKAGGSQL